MESEIVAIIAGEDSHHQFKRPVGDLCRHVLMSREVVAERTI